MMNILYVRRDLWHLQAGRERFEYGLEIGRGNEKNAKELIHISQELASHHSKIQEWNV